MRTGAAWSVLGTILFRGLAEALLLPLSTIQTTPGGRPAAAITIHVCQNKECCRRFGMSGATLFQVVHDLFGEGETKRSTTTIASSGCLAQCDQGPNLKVESVFSFETGRREVYLREISDPFVAAAELQALLGLELPRKRLAAVTVLEKAHKSKYW
jgi:hypothetical protein